MSAAIKEIIRMRNLKSEIVERLKRGEVVEIPTSYAFVFMRECGRNGIASSAEISMVVDGNICVMQMRRYITT